MASLCENSNGDDSFELPPEERLAESSLPTERSHNEEDSAEVAPEQPNPSAPVPRRSLAKTTDSNDRSDETAMETKKQAGLDSAESGDGPSDTVVVDGNGASGKTKEDFQDEFVPSDQLATRQNGDSIRAAPQAPGETSDKTQQPSRPESTKKKPPDLSPEMREFQETGRWGSVSSNERRLVIGFVAIVVLVAIGVIVSVALVRSDDDDNSNNNDSDRNIVPATLSPTQTPVAVPVATFAPTDRSAFRQQLLNDLFGHIDRSDVAFRTTISLPISIDYYSDKWLGTLDSVDLNSPDSPSAQEIATAWLFWDERQELGRYYYNTQDSITDTNLDRIVERWTLASLFLQLGGTTTWTQTGNWMDATVHHCQWHGIVCDPRTDRVTALELRDTGLSGSGNIPLEFVLLTAVTIINLRNNQLQHSIPNGRVFGDLPNLVILNLRSNQLTGPVPNSLLRSGSLQTLLVQDNSFTGIFPLNYCPERKGETGPLSSFVIDCADTGGTVTCPVGCCTPYNCS